jgi:deazaflavin-dependent oxidoreductase (nitroreductase family)
LQPQFLYLTTKGWKTGKEHKIEIWFVEHGGKYYIVSERREQAHWVQNVLRNPQVSFSIGSKAFDGVARTIGQGNLADRVSGLMDAKYGWSQGLIVELEPQKP